ncbi:hypothetical protein E5161_01275 [Cohnella pontilimi]|uniref:Uncharacterized protein n=1 Tax=Cohnella pontilimi TaxID=2564100 RepID=A0A4U0FHV3_9BACL|nr:hypothetical protein E5161_01275 [Cohnella pontilimi]
MRKPDCFWKYA